MAAKRQDGDLGGLEVEPGVHWPHSYTAPSHTGVSCRVTPPLLGLWSSGSHSSAASLTLSKGTREGFGSGSIWVTNYGSITSKMPSICPCPPSIIRFYPSTLSTLGTVQGAQDAGTHPFFKTVTDLKETTDVRTAKSKVCTGMWEHSTRFVGEDGNEVCLGH